MNLIENNIWIKLCKEYHINKYNILYINNYDDYKDNGYYLNKNSMNLFNDSKIIFTDILNDIEYPKINLIKEQ